SNPDGFCAALDVLDSLGKAQGGRRIIITPGMVELGTAHDTEHEKIGRYAATRVDHLLLVVPQRIQALARGFVAGGGAEQQMMRFETFAEARQWLDDNQRPNDVVLLENDLPDLYEEKISL
ncbi:MAG: UDP-N-acetylmuramoyl-tripeptide--D-alanyl-D-alanine ligase, partial [Alphaproteobacteria bacterium]|nr:UDP-N-acetylmuramoyl-tripeptide--D-alanyl-D-alanine ligase [Alphaproteobacteria bacterium]